MLPPVGSPPPLHPSPQPLSLNMQVPTIEQQPEAHQLRLQHAYLFKPVQEQIQQLQLQVQNLQWHITYLQQQHAQLLVIPQVEPPLQQQRLFQQQVPMDDSLQSMIQPWASMSHPLAIQSGNNQEHSWQVHCLPTIQKTAPSTLECNRNEAEPQDQVEIGSKTEAKRPRWRLTDEQSRDIISHRQGEKPASYGKIAKAIGCSRSTAWRHKHKHQRQKKTMQKEDAVKK
ncbi:MAG: hypothetical protein J3Q66DRAFT_438416 [Benniella sp.]|nr:MAG: hypothetical protein J3Q66DRAFT_438416 [Benniella sp.]